jgi:Phosphatidylserine/phosphatidylglycerophosphate/cardiolipin synthases and related enzymes
MGIGKDLENLIKKEEAKASKRHNSKSNNFRFSGKESHNKELINAFKNATDTLCIRSAFISKFVVNERFEQLLTDTLSRSVNVYIETGYKFSKTPQPEKIQTKEAIDRLRKIEAKFHGKKGFGKLYVGRTPIHMKEISVDSRYFLSGSNNWLSNKSFQNKESSLRIIDQAITKEIRDEAIISVRSNQIIPKIL